MRGVCRAHVGSNLQSVQMIDLDGDGSEEAVAFFRRASDKKPMKIYIFKADGDSYERYAVIRGHIEPDFLT